MRAAARILPGLLACVVLGACAAAPGVSSGDDVDCVSHYLPVANAPTWSGLREAMLRPTRWGRVSSVRVQEQGRDVVVGRQHVVRVVDLLDRRGRRLVQADVWRTEQGAWRAGVWEQCID